MENNFEKFIGENQGQFEKGGPSPEVWQKLKGQLVQHHEQKTILFRQKLVRLSVAASIALVLGMGFVYYLAKNERNIEPAATLVRANPQEADTTITKLPKADAIDSQKIMARKLAMEKFLSRDTFPVAGRNSGNFPGGEKEYTQSLFYYTSLVEKKQKQISRLLNADPDLEAAFEKALDDMRDIYKKLQNKLPQSIDQEKVLQDMIDNLKIQALILNNQLQLIKKMESDNSQQHEKQKDDI